MTLTLRQPPNSRQQASTGEKNLRPIFERPRIGVLTSSNASYRIRTDALDTYLIPKKERPISIESLHDRGRGIAHTRSAAAYLFTKVKR